MEPTPIKYVVICSQLNRQLARVLSFVLTYWFLQVETMNLLSFSLLDTEANEILKYALCARQAHALFWREFFPPF